MTAKEIKDQIEQTKKEIADLNGKKYDLTEQYRDALQSEFEAKHGVKSGDKLTTKNGTVYYYDKFTIDTFDDVVILCHPVKKDGTASKAGRHIGKFEL